MAVGRVSGQAVQVGVLVGLGNLLIFNHFLPSVADVRQGTPHDPIIEGSERTALFVGIGFSVIAAAYVRSFDTFVVATAVLVAADFAYKHANAHNPSTGKMQPTNASGLDTGADNTESFSMPDYSGSAPQS
jgi:hypothetical protein